ncbi:MAG: Holliday junction branch migration protein RuvA [Chitinivibrionales bacterium]|nr:Holliday junction branch migration protein RuvA [Chitinivibrionales bacterium]
MFEYIQGILQEKSQDTAVIDAGGVGYELSIPFSTFQDLPDYNEQVKLFTHFHVREDCQRLYGFSTKPQREVFRQLINVNQVGPKVALNVLSGLSVADIVSAVATADARRLQSISGIGPKTAQRLVLELKGKLMMPVDTPVSKAAATTTVAAQPTVRMDVYAALLALGYSEYQVNSAINRVAASVDEDASVEQWIKTALRLI